MNNTELASQPSAESDPESFATELFAALGAIDRAERARAIEGAAELVDPDLLVEAVADQSDARRRNAAMDALARGGARSVPALIRALRHGDAEVVMFSAGVLARTGSPAAIPHLVSLLDHTDINVTQQVIDSLSQLRSSLAVGALLRVLDRDPWLRFAAVHALGEIGDERAVPALTSLLEDESVRDVVISAMGKIGSAEALRCLFRVLRESGSSETFGLCLRSIGEALEFQPNEEALQRIAEWTELASPISAEVQDRLKQVLIADAAEEAMVDGAEARKAAAMIVKALKVRPLYTALVLAGRDPTLRQVLEFSAVSIGEEIVPVLEQGLDSSNTSVRLLACECLGAMGCRPAAARIQTLLRDPDRDTRASAIHALMRVGHDPAVPAIAECLTDAEPTVREAAVTALCRMDVEAVTQALLQQAERSTVSRHMVLSIMRANPHAHQRHFILACLTDPAAPVRRAAAEALARQPTSDIVGSLEPLLRDSESEVRRKVVEILGSFRSRRVRKLLAEQAERDPETRAAAVRALGNLGDTTVIPSLLAIFEGEPPESKLAIVEALSGLPDPATELFLARQLGSGDPRLRRASALALGRIGSPTALRQLIPATRDSDEGVRAAVAEALGPCDEPAARDALSRLALDRSRKVALLARQSLERSAISE
jgi:HEAT repeat protein